MRQMNFLLGAKKGLLGWGGGQEAYSGLEKGVITKGVFSLEGSLESLKSLEDGRILLCFPQSGGS